MTQAASGNTVKVHYTGKLSNGQVFDSSEGKTPLEFTIGNGQIIKGFENGVIGMEVGEKKTLNVPAEEGYGEHREELVAVVDKNNIPEHIDLAVGRQLQLQQQDGQQFNVTITDISDKDVTLDANHPLAGKELVFDVEMVSID